jgi:hypothetical protein
MVMDDDDLHPTHAANLWLDLGATRALIGCRLRQLVWRRKLMPWEATDTPRIRCLVHDRYSSSFSKHFIYFSCLLYLRFIDAFRAFPLIDPKSTFSVIHIHASQCAGDIIEVLKLRLAVAATLHHCIWSSSHP